MALLLVGALMVAILSFGIILDTHTHTLNKQLTKNIERYNEVDYDQLCQISECKKVERLTVLQTYINIKGHLEFASNTVDEGYKIHDNLYLVDDKLALYHEKTNSYFILDAKSLFILYLRAILVFAPLSLLIFIFPLIKSIREEKNNSLIMSAGNEAILSNKSMIAIAENIHHELNTPLEVIDNKIEKIYEVLTYFIKEEEKIFKKIPTLPEDRIKRNAELKKIVETDFEFIRTASEQIYFVLEKMKKFKHLRYSNGNKSIKNIIEGGFQIIKLSNSNFDYQVDDKLYNYYLKTKTIQNAELLSIILNHIKNSLEANSNKIAVVYSGIIKNKLRIRIVDNGNGVPLDAQKHIFEPNFSTKNIDGGIRGNGMFLNKEILKNIGGNVSLIDTSIKGTTIELEIPVELKN